MNQKIILLIMISAVFITGVMNAQASPLMQSENEIELVLPEIQEEETNSDINDNSGISLVNENDAESEDEIVIVNTRTEKSETENDPDQAPEEQTPETEKKELPERPVPENPKGNFTSRAMGFYWTPSNFTDYYQVNWRNDRGNQEILELENDDWTCQMNRCIVYAELPANGNYTWTVTAFNENGEEKSEEVNFTVRVAVESPDAYRPNTRLSSQRPLTFEWQDLGSAASAYRIQVADAAADKIVFEKKYSSDGMNHINGVCYLQTDEYLSEGSYQWRVQAENGSDKSEWSAWTAFETYCADCSSGNYLNSTSAAIYPKGVAADTKIRFVWKALTGVISYQIKINDEEGATLFDEEVLPTSCLIESCAYEPELELTVGKSYTWKIEAYGWNGVFWGSDEDSFTVVSAPEMKDFSFIGPESNASLDPDNQQIVWTDPGVDTPVFRLGIRDENDEWLFITDLSREEAWCDSITCSIQFQSIPAGENYEIVLIPYSEYNTPGQAVTLTFNNN